MTPPVGGFGSQNCAVLGIWEWQFEPSLPNLFPQLDRNRPFIESQLRFQLATAAYGTVTALQVLTKQDPQVAKAIDVTPRARDLAMAAMRARMQQP